MAVLSAYSTWRHLAKTSLSVRIYIYVLSGMFASTFTLQSLSIAYRNRTLSRHGTRAKITRSGTAIFIVLELSRPLRVEAGQYIHLWLPGVSPLSFLQTHPFTVVSWSPGKQRELVLLVEPRKGLTKSLATAAASPHLALFSGPHGKSTPVGNYETVLMLASGFGIAAQLPYLKQLMHGHEASPRRVHLVWQVENIGERGCRLTKYPLINRRDGSPVSDSVQ